MEFGLAVRHAPRRGRPVAAAVCLLLALVASLVTACAAQQQKRVLMFGDSITYESMGQLKARGIEVHSFGGTAICDWFAEMRRQAATRTVQTVYLEFVGNRFTACVRDRPLTTAYRDDARTAVGIWRAARVRVVWVRPPQPKKPGVPTAPAPKPTAAPSAPATSRPTATPTTPPVSAPPTTPPTSAFPTPSATGTPGPAPSDTVSPSASTSPSAEPSSPPALEPTDAPGDAPTPDPIPEPTLDPTTGSTSSTRAPSGALKAVALSDAELAVIQHFDEVQAILLAAGADAVVDTSRLIAPNRVFTQYLPCRVGEPCNVLAPKGYDSARAADGLHLCPTQLKTVNGVVTATCSVYSISAARFAEQVAAVS